MTSVFSVSSPNNHSFKIQMFSCSFFYKRRGYFDNTFPIGYVVASHDFTSKTLLKLYITVSILHKYDYNDLSTKEGKERKEHFNST